MPPRIKKVCRARLCSRLTIESHGYCQEHADLATGWRRVAVKSPEARGYDWAWRKQRKRILARDRGLCQMCLRAGRVTAATEVDHIVNKASGGSDADTNLEAICSPCHAIKTRAEATAGRHG